MPLLKVAFKDEYGIPENFQPLGKLEVPKDAIEKLPSGIRTEIKERYEHLEQGIKLFNDCYSLAINIDTAQKFKSSTKKLRATVRDPNVTLNQIRISLRERVQAADDIEMCKFKWYLHKCDEYQRNEKWDSLRQQAKDQRIPKDEKEKTLARLNFLQTQWQEHAAYAYYPTELLLKLIEHAQEIEEVLTFYLNIESAYFNNEAKFFFEDVRKVLAELKLQREIIANAAYHRLRVAKKKQDPEFSDLLFELRTELKSLGLISPAANSSDLIQKSLETEPRRELGKKRSADSNKTVADELEDIITRYGSEEIKARLSNLNTYDALSNKLAIPVNLFEKNILPLPGIYVSKLKEKNKDANITRFAELSLDDFEALKLSREEQRQANKNELGWWDRWTQCEYNITNHRSFRFYNACAIVAQRNLPLTDQEFNSLKLNPPLTADEIATLNDPQKSKLWIKSNAERLLNLLDPDTENSPVIKSWASLSWWPWADANRVSKMVAGYRKIFEKAKEGSVQYLVPNELETDIPLDKGNEGSYKRVRYDFFLGKTYIAQFNELAHAITNNFEERFRGLNRPEHNLNPLTRLEITLRLKEIAEVEKVIVKMEAQINEHMPNFYNPRNWFSSEAKKTRAMLENWQKKLTTAKNDLETKRKQIAKFIADNIEKYIDETEVNAIDVRLIIRLKTFTDTYGTEEDKKAFKTATTIGGIFAKYVKENRFVKMTAHVPKQNIAINIENIKRILAIGLKFSLPDSKNYKALERVCNLIKGKLYPENKAALINDLKLVLGAQALTVEFIKNFIDNIIKPYWNPYAKNAEAFIKDICGPQFASFKRQQDDIAAEKHAIIIEFLQQKVIASETGIVLAENTDLTSNSEKRYRLNESARVYAPATIFEYVDHHNPLNIVACEDKTIRDEQILRWKRTLEYARSHSLQTDDDSNQNQPYGKFNNGEHSYAAEVISKIGDFQSIYNYTLRLLRHHLFNEHREQAYGDPYQLPESERALFLEKFPQATSMGYLQAINEYVSNDKFSGQSYQFAKLLTELCASSHVNKILGTEKRTADDFVQIPESIDDIKKKTRMNVIQWGIKRFKHLIQFNHYVELEEDDNSFFQLFIADEPELKNQLQKCVLDWLKQQGYRGNHNAFWKIITWLGDYAPGPKGYLTNQYACLRLGYLFKNKLPLDMKDDLFLKYNQHVDGFIRTIILAFLEKLEAPDYTVDRHDYLSLVMWLKSLAVEDESIRELVNRLIAAYARNRLTYLMSNNIPLDENDWKYLESCKDCPDIKEAVAETIKKYVDAQYDGSTTTFISLVLGYQSSFTNNPHDKQFIYQPYSVATVIGRYAAKRLTWLMFNSKKMSFDDLLISELFDYAADDVAVIKDIVAYALTDMLALPKCICWVTSHNLPDDVIQSYTAFVQQIVSSRTSRSEQQLNLMEQYVSRRLLFLMKNNQSSATEEGFFNACLNENRIITKLSHLVMSDAKADIISLDNFHFIQVINKLSHLAISVYYAERFKHLFKLKDKKTFPVFDLENLSAIIKQDPLIKQLNENLKTLLTNRVDHIHSYTMDDQRIVQLLKILALRPENEQFIADHAAMILDKYLEKRVEPPAFFREFCCSSNSALLKASLNEITKIYLDKHKLLVHWNEKPINEYVMAASLFGKADNLWYKVIMNYASDQTYDDCIVPIMHGYMRLNSINGFADFKATLQSLESNGNKKRSIPSTEQGRARFDAIIDRHVYVDSKSCVFSKVVCQVVEDNCCTEAQKDKYRCGELVRRLVNEGTDQTDFNAFFEIADKSNWDRKDIAPRVNFITQNCDTFNRAIRHCLDNMPWHGNAQRVIHNYASPDIAAQYHAKWYLSQLAHRPANIQHYRDGVNNNYSSIEDESNKQDISAESRLHLNYGVHLDSIVSASRTFLEQMRQDNILAIEIIESHFKNGENHKYKQELTPFIERYNFVMLNILEDWKNNRFTDATHKLKSRMSAAVGHAAVKSAENAESADRKQAWEISYIERAKHCAEEYIKTLLHSEKDTPERKTKIIKVAKSFIDCLHPNHEYKIDGEFLFDLSKGNEKTLMAAMKCAEALAKIQQIIYLASQKPLSTDLMFYDTNDLLNVFNQEQVAILAAHLPTKEINTLHNSLNEVAQAFISAHPLAKVITAFACELTQLQRKEVSITPNNTAFERFASVVAINRQVNKYFNLQMKLKAVNSLSVEEQRDFDKASKDNIDSLYLVSVVEKLLSDRGYAIIQREDDDFEIDSWQDTFIERFGTKEQKSRLTQIKQARIIYSQLDQLITLTPARATAAINLCNIVTKNDAKKFAKVVVENINQRFAIGSFKLYLNELINNILTTHKVSDEEVKLWPFIAAFINESGLYDKLAGEINFLVAKALVMLDPVVTTTGDAFKSNRRLYFNVIKAFGSLQQQQSAKFVVENFIPTAKKTANDFKSVDESRPQKRLLEAPKTVTSQSTQSQLVEFMERFNIDSSNIITIVLKNLSALMLTPPATLNKEQVDEILCVVQWVASPGIKNLAKNSDAFTDALAALEINLISPKVKDHLPIFFAESKKLQQHKAVQQNFKLLIALMKVKENIFNLAAMLEAEDEKSIITQIRNTLTVFNEFIGNCDRVDSRSISGIQKAKESFKHLMLEKYPHLFVPPSIDSVVHLFGEESSSDNSSEAGSPGRWSLANSSASSVAPSRPGTPPAISRCQSSTDLTVSPAAVMSLTPPPSPNKPAASASSPIIVKNNSFFGMKISINPVQESDKESDGLNRYIEERNKQLSELYREIIRAKGSKPVSFDEKCKAIIETNKCILTISKAIKEKLHKRLDQGFDDANDAAMIKLQKTALSDIYKTEVEFLANIKDDYEALGSAEVGIGKDVSTLFKKAFDDLNYTAVRSDSTPIEIFMTLFEAREAIRNVAESSSAAASTDRSMQLAM